MDWEKQQFLIQDFRKHCNLVREDRLIVVSDSSTDLNVYNSQYRFYSWNGLFRESCGARTFTVINLSDLEAYLNGEFNGDLGVAIISSKKILITPTTKLVFVEIFNSASKNGTSLNSNSLTVKISEAVLHDLKY